MTGTTDRGTGGFTHTLNGFGGLGAIFGLDPTSDVDACRPPSGSESEALPALDIPQSAPSDADAGAGEGAPEPDPVSRLASVKAIEAALAARREQDRVERTTAFCELERYDAVLAGIQVLERELADARAVRAGLEDALARPFDDPEWIYDQELRDDYTRAVAEAAAAETAFAALIEDRRREAEQIAAQPTVARLLAERRRHEEAVRAQENAAEAYRQRSQAMASATSLRDAGSFEEARQVLGPVASRYPDDPEIHSLHSSIDRAERAVKDAQAAATLAEARRLRRSNPEGACALLAAIDTALLSADRMHEVAGVAADIARHRELVNPLFLRGRAPNSLAVIAEQRGQWEVAIAVGQDPLLQPGHVVPPHLAGAARPLHRRR